MFPPTIDPPPPSPRASGPAGSITVTQLTALIRAAIQRHLPKELTVVGELSNVSRPASGHLYFTLKDAGSEARCAMWRSAAAGLRFAPMDGLSVVAVGGVDVYEPRGQVQFYVRRLEPVGVGALELAFRQLKEKLAGEGLFDPRRKKPLPRWPRTIALVTSPSGAVIRDMLQTIRRRFPCIRVLFHPVPVQGEDAAGKIAAALAAINQHADSLGGIDVVIVGRGGGSLEDLWAFNEEIVARAIAASRIPVVSAVGHETDVSIADMVADVRAATPTAAAELVTPLRTEVLADLDMTAARLRRGVAARLQYLAARLARMEAFEAFRAPLVLIRRREQRLDEATARLRAAAVQRFASQRGRLHRAEMRLQHVRPEMQIVRRRERLARMEFRLRWAQGHVNVVAERRLATAASRFWRESPRRRTQCLAVLFEQLSVRLAKAVAAANAHRREHVAHAEARLDAAGPRRVLARGFSITRLKKTRAIVIQPGDVREGDRLITQTASGAIESIARDARQGELF